MLNKNGYYFNHNIYHILHYEANTNSIKCERDKSKKLCGFMVNQLLLLIIIIIILEKDFLLGYLEVFVLKEMIHNKIPNG